MPNLKPFRKRRSEIQDRGEWLLQLKKQMFGKVSVNVVE